MKYSFGNLVRHAIARHLGVREECIEPSQRLREDLGLHPLDLVLVALCLEEVAHARFPVEGLGTVYTVEELTGFLWSCRCARPSELAMPAPAPRPPRRSLPVVMPVLAPPTAQRSRPSSSSRAPRH